MNSELELSYIKVREIVIAMYSFLYHSILQSFVLCSLIHVLYCTRYWSHSLCEAYVNSIDFY